jgi:hypothetical protein
MNNFKTIDNYSQNFLLSGFSSFLYSIDTVGNCHELRLKIDLSNEWKGISKYEASTCSFITYHIL